MKSQHSPAFLGIGLLTILFLSCTIMVSCSKKSDGVFIKAEKVIITNTDLNGCTVGGGTGTQFNYTIPYTTSPDITIEKVEWITKFSDGDKIGGEYDVSDGTDGNLDNVTCVRFGTTTWIETTYILVGSNGVKSNPQTLKINKPAGAQ